MPIVPLFIGPRWSTYSTKYFHCFNSPKNFYGDPIFTHVPGQHPVVHPHLPRRPGRRRKRALSYAAGGDSGPARAQYSSDPITMRWFLRRLVFYVFAIWVALTLNFLLPRLMPGDPIGGVLQHLSPGADPGEPGDHPDLRGAARRRQGLDLARLRRLPAPARAPQLRHLDLELPGAGLRGRSGGRCPTRSSSSASRSCSRSSSARRSAWSPPGAAAASSTPSSCPTLHGARRVPGVLHRAARRLLPRAASSTGSRSSTRTTATSIPGFNWAFISSAVRHARAAGRS